MLVVSPPIVGCMLTPRNPNSWVLVVLPPIVGACGASSNGWVLVVPPPMVGCLWLAITGDADGDDADVRRYNNVWMRSKGTITH